MKCYKASCTQPVVAHIIIHTTDPMALAVCEKHAQWAESIGRTVVRDVDLTFEPPSIRSSALAPQTPSPGWRGVLPE